MLFALFRHYVSTRLSLGAAALQAASPAGCKPCRHQAFRAQDCRLQDMPSARPENLAAPREEAGFNGENGHAWNAGTQRLGWMGSTLVDGIHRRQRSSLSGTIARNGAPKVSGMAGCLPCGTGGSRSCTDHGRKSCVVFVLFTQRAGCSSGRATWK